MSKIVPNQKQITIKREKTIKDQLYTKINLDSLHSAALDLDAGAFKLWCYFVKNQDNYVFALSRQTVEETFGIKVKQYNNAISELIKKGYLEEVQQYKYIFHEKPRDYER